MVLERVYPALAAILFVINLSPVLAQDVNPGEVMIWPMIETPKAVFNVREIAAHDRPRHSSDASGQR